MRLKRVSDDDVMHLLNMILKASGSKGVSQGGVISPLLSNIYLDQVDRMLERAKETTRNGKYTYLEYARFADDLVILVDALRRFASAQFGSPSMTSTRGILAAAGVPKVDLESTITAQTVGWPCSRGEPKVYFRTIC